MNTSSAHWTKIDVRRDGNAMYALVGPNLVTGHAIFVEMPRPATRERMQQAGDEAVRRLREILPYTRRLPVARSRDVEEIST